MQILAGMMRRPKATTGRGGRRAKFAADRNDLGLPVGEWLLM
jgi:hypothetical protein